MTTQHTTTASRLSLWLATQHDAGLSDADIAAGLQNGEIEAPEWLCTQDDVDHCKIWAEGEGCAQMSFAVLSY